MERRLPRQLDVPAEIAVALMEAAVEVARRNAKMLLRSHRPRRGQTLHPGIDTPLWNTLARALDAQLTRYGEKARLARVLGLPRQRVHDFLRARRHLPDAERTLLLLAWLHARRNGGDLA
ncbi:MAG TPA: hypothetical protein VHE13_16110 [Opitutus sp.]|nr:hypothetical protein [Opitutus sp.]